MAKKEIVDVATTVEEELQPLTASQAEMVSKMIENAVRQNKGETDRGISVYGMRDPKSIETVNVKRIDGKFVIGFKNLQKDKFKKDIPLYIEYKFDPIAKRDRQPYITLILSSDGETTEEKEMLLSDYYYNREYFTAKVLEVKVTKEIQDHGLLGGSTLAREVDNNNKVVSRSAIKAESMIEHRTFIVELPDFKEPVVFTDDPTGPLA